MVVVQQNRDCPRTGAVPGFCGPNQRSFIVRKHLGQPPMWPGTVPGLLRFYLSSTILPKYILIYIQIIPTRGQSVSGAGWILSGQAKPVAAANG